MNTSISEIAQKVGKIKTALDQYHLDSLLLRSIPNCLYLTGSVFRGYIYIDRSLELPLLFLERPTDVLEGYPEDCIYSIRKPELIPDILKERGLTISNQTALELGYLPVTDYLRLSRLSPVGVSDVDASVLMRQVRSVKTDQELTELRRLAEIHMEIYRIIPELFRPGMSELDLQHQIEYQMRRRGSVGLFRAFGPDMEIFMGNVISGDNADNPAPYDFTMGGKGVFAMPMGATNREIKPDTAVMVDMSGNYGVYQTDITRTYYLGELPEKAIQAHKVSQELLLWFESYAKEGVPVSEIYQHCAETADKAGLSDYFMGHRNQVKFVGHGVGIEINEVPVLTARSKDIFQSGMVIALEPKFVIPGIGALGAENTYIIGDNGAENITPLPTDLIPLTETL
ncbi:MAG: Xaa-Pro peptidase family protein [Porphyromonas sp.]|nr:Xaa-Pro peptidase family protein [Porphyromonas sp.]